MNSYRSKTFSAARRVVLILMVAVMTVSLPAQAQSYGYGREKDPLILGVKKAIREARADESAALEKAVSNLSWQVDEIKVELGVDLKAEIDQAIAGKDSKKIAYALTHLVFQALRQKFHWNTKEKLAQYMKARSRLDAAQFYYESILSHAVRRADKSGSLQRHREILQWFRKSRETLGSPGLFGVGKKNPELKLFVACTEKIETLILEVFTDFIGAQDKEKGKDEKPASKPKK